MMYMRRITLFTALSLLIVMIFVPTTIISGLPVSTGHKYMALVVAGSEEARFTHDALMMYNTLIDHYDFTANDIYLLTPHDYDSYSASSVPRDAITSKDNVLWAIDEIADKVRYWGQVVIWWTGHGINYSFSTYSGCITAWELDDALDTIYVRYMYTFLGPCCSGSFINIIQGSRRAIYTSCDAGEYAAANSQHSFWPWATYRALDPDLNAADADTNYDEIISLWEVYNYAYNYIIDLVGYQHPQRWVGSEINPDSNRYIGMLVPIVHD